MEVGDRRAVGQRRVVARQEARQLALGDLQGATLPQQRGHVLIGARVQRGKQQAGAERRAVRRGAGHDIDARRVRHEQAVRGVTDELDAAGVQRSLAGHDHGPQGRARPAGAPQVQRDTERLRHRDRPGRRLRRHQVDPALVRLGQQLPEAGT